MFDIWKTRYELVENVYRGANYKKVENINADNNRCILYFSSNEIWYPNTKQSFEHSFLDNDYYEWIKYGCIQARKAIFFRDIYKSWYVTGISQSCSSVNELLSFIKEETKGMRVITVGSSAGGYMAALVASILDAERAICFSAQFDLSLEIENPFLKKYKNEKERSQYYELFDFVNKSNTTIFYIMPAFNKEDIRQFEYIKSARGIQILQIASKHHGVPVFKGNLYDLLKYDEEAIKKLFQKYSGKIVRRMVLSIEISGVKKTVVYICKDILNLCKKVRKRLK